MGLTPQLVLKARDVISTLSPEEQRIAYGYAWEQLIRPKLAKDLTREEQYQSQEQYVRTMMSERPGPLPESFGRRDYADTFANKYLLPLSIGYGKANKNIADVTGISKLVPRGRAELGSALEAAQEIYSNVSPEPNLRQMGLELIGQAAPLAPVGSGVASAVGARLPVATSLAGKAGRFAVTGGASGAAEAPAFETTPEGIASLGAAGAVLSALFGGVGHGVGRVAERLRTPATEGAAAGAKYLDKLNAEAVAQGARSFESATVAQRQVIKTKVDAVIAEAAKAAKEAERASKVAAKKTVTSQTDQEVIAAQLEANKSNALRRELRAFVRKAGREPSEAEYTRLKAGEAASAVLPKVEKATKPSVAVTTTAPPMSAEAAAAKAQEVLTEQPQVAKVVDAVQAVNRSLVPTPEAEIVATATGLPVTEVTKTGVPVLRVALEGAEQSLAVDKKIDLMLEKLDTKVAEQIKAISDSAQLTETQKQRIVGALTKSYNQMRETIKQGKFDNEVVSAQLLGKATKEKGVALAEKAERDAAVKAAARAGENVNPTAEAVAPKKTVTPQESIPDERLGPEAELSLIEDLESDLIDRAAERGVTGKNIITAAKRLWQQSGDRTKATYIQVLRDALDKFRELPKA